MKRVILSLVFVLAMGTSLMNASVLDPEVKNCSQIAFDLQADLMAIGASQESANETANLIYEICELEIQIN